MPQDAKLDRLAGIPLFAGAQRRQLERIARLCTEVTVPPGRVLCRQGESGREFFVIEEGTVTVSNSDRQLATLGPGDFFGELALLDGKTRNATVTADSKVRLLVLTRQEFAAVLDDDPAVAVQMLPAIGARLRGEDAAEPGRPPVV